jgi:flagellar biosynthesis protein FliP
VTGLAVLVTQNPTIDLGNGGVSAPVQILVLLTLLTVLPGMLFMVTGFTRILIVLGFVRNALGTPTMPPNQVLVGIAVFLTIFIMAPTLSEVNDTAVQPFTAKKITLEQAIERGQEPLRTFMFKQTRDSDLALFVRMADLERPQTRADVPTHVLIPAFMISELKTAFQIGFLIYLPFLIIDLVVAATLMSMGMMMLPPVLISLPFKIMLFVLVDGWSLVAQGLVQSFST